MGCYRIKAKPMTLWEAKEVRGERHGYLPKRPKRGQGHPEYPDLWPEEVANEKKRVLPDISGGFMCGDLGPHCKESGCGDVGDYLCDWPMGKGVTCDLPMCEEHAREIGVDRHFCPVHHRLWQAKTAPPGGNPWPPKTKGVTWILCDG